MNDIPTLFTLKIANLSSYFQPLLQSLPSHFHSIYGVCQVVISVFSITIVKNFCIAISIRRCWFIINIMNDIPTLLTLKIANLSSHFWPLLQSSLSHFQPIYGVCQVEISVFSITIVKENFCIAISKCRCWFIINKTNDIPTLLTLAEVTYLW